MEFIERFTINTASWNEVSNLTQEQFSKLSYTDRLAIKNNFPLCYERLVTKEREMNDRKIKDCGREKGSCGKPAARYDGEMAYNFNQSQWQLRGRHGKFL